MAFDSLFLVIPFSDSICLTHASRTGKSMLCKERSTFRLDNKESSIEKWTDVWFMRVWRRSPLSPLMNVLCHCAFVPLSESICGLPYSPLLFVLY